MNNWCICWFSRIYLLGILIFKGLTARRLYKSFGVKELNFLKHIPPECTSGCQTIALLLYAVYVEHITITQQCDVSVHVTGTE
jgi:hypothetical protein